MTVIGGWLRQIILIIFLAILADFLLPTKSMQKYVRMVMGLAVIAAMLQPVMPLFQGGWANQLAEKATSEILSSPSSTHTRQSYDVSNLKQQFQTEQSNEEVALLEQRLKVAVADACNCTVTAVQVATDNTGMVRSVTVETPNANQSQTRDVIIQYLTVQLALSKDQIKVVN
ncbi:stage III sporulation protein AF [Alicyclobacillus ferrooxydans]|uniref:Stage III sporulation protein AF n=1 Tax=Alicyclobacillus ferrooxydans TaxID=471514 RepID=A0A0P9CU96_9BACL|nr:stage III sporulation protein AF [Alicyclobacillus ferrooxydans]KPV43251.1 hypothetical protein AN477_13490 [Alicyclobacillus ferrooxydans]